MFSLVISQLAVALIGGNAIAGERADRSAEFLASLPITRKKILGSKLLLSLAIVGVIWTIDASALLGLARFSGQFGNDAHPVLAALTTLGCIAIVAMMFFGVSWLFSSFLSSPTFAVGGGLIVPLLLYAGIASAAISSTSTTTSIGQTGAGAVVFSYFGLGLALAALCFGVGTWYYLRRVEP